MPENLGKLVSRVLDPTHRSYNGIIFQQKRPPLDSEWNLVQDLCLDSVANTIRNTTPSGFLQIGPITTAPSGLLLTANWQNIIIFNNPIALVNGWIIQVGGGTNLFQSGAQTDIWHTLSNNLAETVVIGAPAPTYGAGFREDLVFLEVWQYLLGTADTVYNYGFTQSAVPPFANDLIDTNMGIETTKRIQIQYRIRWVSGCDFTSYRNGLGYPGCYAQGAQSSINTSYTFSQSPTDPGLYVSGDGSLQAQTDLGTVDGYVYAIPLARVHRRNRQAYSPVNNLNGAALSLLSGLPSERPDGLYYDEIADTDVESLRHEVSLDGFDLSQLLEENLAALWNKTLPTELKTSSLDLNLSGNSLIQIDAISSAPITGANNVGRHPDGLRRTFIDARVIQETTWTQANPTLYSTTQLWFSPIGFQINGSYSVWDQNKFWVSEVAPTVIIYAAGTSPSGTSSRQVLVGGTWFGLGDFRTWDYADPTTGNAIYYEAPGSINLADWNVSITFNLINREGGGLDTNSGGFTFNTDTMFSGYNNTTGVLVDCNNYSVPTTPISTTLTNGIISPFVPRVTAGYTDSGVSISIQSFQDALNPINILNYSYMASAVKLEYYNIVTGPADTIPKTLYGRTVVGVHSILNVTSGNYQIVPTIEVSSSPTVSFNISGLIAQAGNLIHYTLLLGDLCVDYVPHTKGISNFAVPYNFPIPIVVGDTSGVFNVKSINAQMDAAIANAGFYNGTSYQYSAYLAPLSAGPTKQIFLTNLTGLGTSTISFIMPPAAETGTLYITLLGYYTPAVADSFFFQYAYTPYKGIVSTRLAPTGTQQVEILKMDDKIAITSIGTGRVDQNAPTYMLGMTEMLPIGTVIGTSNFFGEDIPTPITGGVSAFRRIASRSLVSTTDHVYLNEGQIVTMMHGTNNTVMGQGVIISSPPISENGINFTPEAPVILGSYEPPLASSPAAFPKYDARLDSTQPSYQPILDPNNAAFDPFYDPALKYNHLSQWSAIVQGLGALQGELFLMVITTTSTVYNALEGSVYEYLEGATIATGSEYAPNALGMGSETILNNTLSSADLTTNLGQKIYGAVDIYPLQNRPITYPG